MPASELVLPSAGSSLSCFAIWSARPRWPLASIQRICGRCLASYRAAVAEVVAGFGGYVAKYMGDGVLAYFGYPQAHEHDAEQAVRAGLALIDRVGRLESGATALASRVGIATGLVVVGDLIGSGEAQERGVVGETPNLAARLQEMAPANAVLVAESTRRLVGDLFDYRDLGAVAIKGLAEPVLAAQVLEREHGREPFRGIAFGDVEPARRPRRGSPVAIATVGPGQGAAKVRLC